MRQKRKKKFPGQDFSKGGSFFSKLGGFFSKGGGFFSKGTGFLSAISAEAPHPASMFFVFFLEVSIIIPNFAVVNYRGNGKSKTQLYHS